MTRPKKLAMESMASLISTHMAAGGELVEAMKLLPEHEHEHYKAAIEGIMNQFAARANRLPGTPIPNKDEVRAMANEVLRPKNVKKKPEKVDETPEDDGEDG